MNLDYIDGLLFSSLTITYDGRSILIPDVVIDTGAAESIISIDAVDERFHLPIGSAIDKPRNRLAFQAVFFFQWPVVGVNLF